MTEYHLGDKEVLTINKDTPLLRLVRDVLETYTYEDTFSWEDVFAQVDEKQPGGFKRETVEKMMRGVAVNNDNRNANLKGSEERLEPDPRVDLVWRVGYRDRSPINRRFRIGVDPFWPLRFNDKGRLVAQDPSLNVTDNASVGKGKPAEPPTSDPQPKTGQEKGQDEEVESQRYDGTQEEPPAPNVDAGVADANGEGGGNQTKGKLAQDKHSADHGGSGNEDGIPMADTSATEGLAGSDKLGGAAVSGSPRRGDGESRGAQGECSSDTSKSALSWSIPRAIREALAKQEPPGEPGKRDGVQSEVHMISRGAPGVHRLQSSGAVSAPAAVQTGSQGVGCTMVGSATESAFVEAVASFIRTVPSCIEESLVLSGLQRCPMHLETGTVHCIAEEPDGRMVLVTVVHSLDEAGLGRCIALFTSASRIFQTRIPPRGVIVVCGSVPPADMSWLAAVAPLLSVFMWGFSLRPVK